MNNYFAVEKKNYNLNDIFIYSIIFIFAFLLRLFLFKYEIFNINILTADSYEYINIAESLKIFGVYGLDGVHDMNRTPLYPYFIFFSNLISDNNLNQTIYNQIFIDSLSCCLIFSIGRKFLKNRFSKIILIFLSISCLYTISYTMMVMTETLYSFLIILSLFLFTNGKKINDYIYNISFVQNLIISSIIAMIILTRPMYVLTIIFFYLFIFLSIIFFERSKFYLNFKKLFLSGFIIVILLSPWTIRNLMLFHDDIFSKNSIATPIGYKTNYNMWKHFYLKEFKNFLKSYEEPFLLMNPIEPPVYAKYVYDGEIEDVKKAFNKFHSIENIKGRNGKQLEYSNEIKKSFKMITEKRYEENPILHFTAPFSRIMKILFAPRITAIGSDQSGFTVSKNKLIIFLIYNFIYVFPGLLFFINRKNFNYNKIFYIYVISIVFSHIYAHSIWMPAPQSRYFIPILPIFTILSAISFDRMLNYLNKKN